MGGSFDSIAMVTAVNRHPQCTGVHSHHKGYGNNRDMHNGTINLFLSIYDIFQPKIANGKNNW